MELPMDIFCLYIHRQFYRWLWHVTVRTSWFESLCNSIGKIAHKNFHIIALLNFLKFFIFCLWFPRYISTNIAKELIWSVNIIAKYRQKNYVGNAVGIVGFLVVSYNHHHHHHFFTKYTYHLVKTKEDEVFQFYFLKLS